MKVKICGLTRSQDVVAACEQGAWATGFIFASSSPRYLTLGAAQELRTSVQAPTLAIGVFQDAALDQILEIADILKLDGVQLHGAETVVDCLYLRKMRPGLLILKSIEEKTSDLHSEQYLTACDAVLLDSTREQVTRQPLDWKRLAQRRLPSPMFLAGGLTPPNLREAIQYVLPCGVDVSSGVETSPGVKDLDLMRQFFRISKEAAT